MSLLEIFSYGTYSDYVSNESSLPNLSPDQRHKLRQLSLLSLAKSPKNLNYGNLLQALELETPRELEDLVISAIYAGLLQGTLDPYHQLVSVSSVSPLRDLAPNSIPSMLNTLDEWSSRCTTTLADLEQQIARVKAEALRRHREEAEWTAQVEKLVEKAEKAKKDDGEGGQWGHTGRRLGAGAAMKRGNGMMGSGADYEDDMDVDDEDEDYDEKRASGKKKRGFANLVS